MTIDVANSTTYSSRGVVTAVLSVPSGYSEDDLLVAHVTYDGGIDTGMTGHASWTEHTNSPWSDGSVTHHVFYKKALVSEAASYTFGTLGATETINACMMLITGYKDDYSSESELFEQFTTNTGGPGTAQTCTSITPTTNGCLIVAATAQDGESTHTGPYATEEWDLRQTQAVGNNSSAGYWEVQASATATGDQDITASSSEGWATVHYAIAPAGVAEGEIYERTLTEEMSLADTQDRNTRALRHLLESMGFDDLVSITKLIPPIERTLSDYLDLDEGHLKNYRRYNTEVTQSFGITDSVTQDWIRTLIAITLSDTMVMTDGDSESRRWLNYNVQDNFEITDFIISEIIQSFVIHELTLTDDIELSDYSRAQRFLSRTLEVDIEFIDSSLAKKWITRLLSSNFELTDIVSSEALHFIQLVSSLAFTDTNKQQRWLYQLLVDDISFNDLVRQQLGILRSLVSYMSIEDAGVEYEQDISIAIQENIDLTDNVIAELVTFGFLNRLLRDDFTISDDVTIEATLRYLRVLADNFDMNDSVSIEKLQKIIRVLSDAMTISDSIHRITDIIRILNSNYYLYDSVSIEIGIAQVVIERLLSDNVGLYDELKRNTDVTRLIADTVTIYDAISRTADFKRLLNDNIDIQDILVQATILQITRVLLEQFDISDRVLMEFITLLRDFGFTHMCLIYAKINMSLDKAPISMKLYVDNIITNLQKR